MVKPDPIPPGVQARILDAAIRAPSGGNNQNWRFVLVDDHDVKAKLAPIYQDCIGRVWGAFYQDRVESAHADPEAPDSKAMLAMQKSANWLADNFEACPLLLFAFVARHVALNRWREAAQIEHLTGVQYDPSGGSIFPAVWSAMLAARAEGVGTAFT